MGKNKRIIGLVVKVVGINYKGLWDNMTELKKLEQSIDNADSIISIQKTFREIKEILEHLYEWLENIEETICKEK